MKAETILRDVKLSIPYDVLASVIPLGKDNAITRKELKKRLKDFNVSELDNCLDTCKRYGAPIAEINGKYYRIETAKEYADTIMRDSLLNKLGVKTHIEYR